MRSTFRILFYINRSKLSRHGEVSVMGRITINGSIAQFSTQIHIKPIQWSTSNCCMRGRSDKAITINDRLESIRFSIEKYYRQLTDNNQYVTAEIVKRAYLGLDVREESLLALFKQHNMDFEKQVGYGRSKSTHYKYCTVYSHLQQFINQTYAKDDVTLKELDKSFIQDFDLYLRQNKTCKVNTIWVYMMPLKRIIRMAINRGYLHSNPFAEYQVSPENVQRSYLTLKDLKLMVETDMPNKSENFVRDIFVFSCYTGMSFSDIKRLTANNLRVDDSGHTWIQSQRQKTNTLLNIKLLKIPKAIIDKYLNNGETIFKVPSNYHCNKILKVISKKLNLNKSVTFHTARHTFATTITLSNGMPIESVSRLLGHTSIKTTQIYAKITNSKLSQDMDVLSVKLNEIEALINA